MSINTYENQRRLRDFSIELIESLKENPVIELTEDRLNNSKFPDKPCQFCGLLGTDKKFKGFYVHNECLDFVTIETRKFMVNTLNLQVKK